MNDPTPPIDRTHPFWQICFQDIFRECLRREPPGSEILKGPALAAKCASIADDCMREMLSPSASCNACRGVGCRVCRYTGKASGEPERERVTIDASEVGELREFLPLGELAVTVAPYAGDATVSVGRTCDDRDFPAGTITVTGGDPRGAT